MTWIRETAQRLGGREGAGVFIFADWESARRFRLALASESIPAGPVRYLPRGHRFMVRV